MIKSISYRSTFFMDRMFNAETDIYSLLEVVRDFNLLPFLTPAKNGKQKFVLNFTRDGDSFRIIAVDNRLDILQNITNAQDELLSEIEFINKSIEIAQRITTVLEHNYTRFAFAPEYLVDGTEDRYNSIYNRLCNDDEIPIEWLIYKTKRRVVNNISINVSEKLQKGAFKFNYENESFTRLIASFDINTLPDAVIANENLNDFYENAVQIVIEAKNQLNA